MLQRFRKTPQTSRWASGSIVGALAVALPACSNDNDPVWRERQPQTNVNVVYDPNVDFSQYQTFAFRDDVDGSAEPLGNLDPGAGRDLELANERIAIELREIGLIEVSPAEADLLAFSLGRTTNASGITWSCVGGFWGGYWYWDFYYYDPCAWVDAEYVELDSTTLVVGLIDPDLAEVAFAGFARNIGAFPGNRRREISVAIARIFDRYPAAPAAGYMLDAGAAAVDAGIPAGDGGMPDDIAADAGASIDAGADAAPADGP